MAGRYKAYPAYKDSGVEWLGEIPEGWKVSCLKRCASINMGQSPNSEDCNQDQIGLPFLQGNAEFGAVYPMAKQYCPIPRKLAGKGDLLFSVRAPVGALNTADKVYGIGRGLCSIRSSEANCQKFIYWVLSTDINQLNAVSTGSTFEAVSVEQVSNLYLSLPHKSEQQTIAKFLDYETAKIDALIAKQEQLIELLKEKRQAVISHAVTKGLNPDAPMKDSGVEWLGQVPEHWEVGKLKNYAILISNKLPIANEKVIALENIESFTGEFIKTSSEYSGEGVLSVEGDILFGKLRPYLAKVFLCKESIYSFGDLLVYRSKSKVLPEFLFYIMISDAFVKIVDSSTYGAKMPRASTEFVNDMRLVVPSINEQEIIVKELSEKIEKIKEINQKVFSSINLLQERKTALISAAVTGKIDVRDWQPPSVG